MDELEDVSLKPRRSKLATGCVTGLIIGLILLAAMLALFVGICGR